MKGIRQELYFYLTCCLKRTVKKPRVYTTKEKLLFLQKHFEKVQPQETNSQKESDNKIFEISNTRILDKQVIIVAKCTQKMQNTKTSTQQ